MTKKKVAIIGGGPAGMMLAAFLDPSLYTVTIYEQNKTFGRKFLVAGKGGFNLTHSEDLAAFIARYTPSTFLAPIISAFDNQQLREWLEDIGIPTFIGSSKRVYPSPGIKPIEVLQKILDVLKQRGVHFAFEHQWLGWNENQHLVFKDRAEVVVDIGVFALGGGSWKVTGANDRWLSVFKNQNIPIRAFKSANCAYQIDWSTDFLQKQEGQALKNIAITCAAQTQKGEAVITKFGIEGNAIYALSPKIQDQLENSGTAQVSLDLKPPLSKQVIQGRLQKSKAKNTTQALRQDLKLSTTKVALIKELLSKAQFQDLDQLAQSIKALPLTLLSAAPIDEAISTTGGINLAAVDANLQLKSMPKYYCIGEMLDWNAPTGGYLLQACLSMGVYLAHYLNQPIASKDPIGKSAKD